MNAIILRRSDDERNLHRYYRLDVQPDLFGAWCVIREWGRIGRTGQVREVPCPTPRRGSGRARQAAPWEGAQGLCVKRRPSEIV
jgi:hypothetical protein